jgi:hypothetical protein
MKKAFGLFRQYLLEASLVAGSAEKLRFSAAC